MLLQDITAATAAAAAELSTYSSQTDIRRASAFSANSCDRYQTDQHAGPARRPKIRMPEKPAPQNQRRLLSRYLYSCAVL